MKDLTDRIATIENLSFEALGNSRDIYNEALSIYRKIYNLESPQVETKYLVDKSTALTRDADRLKTDANRILANNQVKIISLLLKHLLTFHVLGSVGSNKGTQGRITEIIK